MKRLQPNLSKPKKEPKPRLRMCEVCRAVFQKERMGQRVCGGKCGLESARRKREKIERKDIAARKEKLKTRSDYMKEAQIAINRYVNLRDINKACISCGKPPNAGVRHASHYKSRGSNSALTYNLYNINSSCYGCNVAKSGNIFGYRKGIIDRYGVERLEWLDNHPISREYSKEYLIRIKRIFSKKAKRLTIGNV